MKLLQRIVLILELIFEIGLTAIMVPYAIASFFNGDSDWLLTALIAICLIMWLAITVAGFSRIKKGAVVVSTGFGMKFWTFFMMIGLYGFFDDALGMAISFTITGIVILSLLLYFAKKSPNEVQANSQQAKPIEYFQKDKAEYSYDVAADEYCRLHDIDKANMSEEDHYKIYEYAGMYITYFLYWLIINDYISVSFKEMMGEEQIKAVRQRNISPVEIFRNMDNTLSMQEIDNSLRYFMTSYYSKRYFADYYLEIYNEQHNVYCLDFSYDIYDKIAKRIDEALMYFDHSLEDYDFYDEENIREKIYVPAFGQELDIYATNQVSDVYYQRCITHLQNLPETLLSDMKREIYRYVEDYDFADELINGTHITTLFQTKFSAGAVYIETPLNDKVAFQIGFESDLEPEHGLGFTIVEDVLVDYGYRMDIASPWGKEQVYLYQSIKQIKECQFKRVAIRGSEVYVSLIAAEKMQETEILMSMRVHTKMTDYYTCECRYLDNKPIPNRIVYTGYKNEKKVEYTSVQVW